MPPTDRTPEILRAIEEHLSNGATAPERRLVVLAGGVTARGDDALSGAFFPFALDRGADPGWLGEIVLQTHLFAGYPRTINALFALRAAGAPPPSTPEAVPPHAPDAPHPFRARGEALCRRIYGARYDPLRSNIRALHPDLDAWMVDEGYGRVLGRAGPDVATRELAALTALVVLDVPRQVESHLHGALNVGAQVGEIEDAIELAAIVTDPDVADAARATWREIARRRR